MLLRSSRGPSHHRSCCERRSVVARLGLTAFGCLLALGSLPGGTASAETLPTVAETLHGTPFEPKDAEKVVQGKIAITTVDESSHRELVVGLACLAPEGAPSSNPFAAARPMLPADLVVRFEVIDPERVEETLQTLRVTKDGAEELERYLRFEPGIGLNLSRAEFDAFRTLADADDGRIETDQLKQELVRQVSNRVARYRASGLAGIEPYVREKGKQANPAEELRRALAQAHAMEQRFPDFFNFWERFPEFELPGVQQKYFWIRSKIRSRPALILGHQAAWHHGSVRMVAERHFYISHFFNGGYTIAFMMPVQEGQLFAIIERLWVDGYSGMAGLKRSVGRKIIASRLEQETLHRKACRSQYVQSGDKTG